MALPSRYLITYTAADIAQACTRLGQEIAVWAVTTQREGSSLLTIPILRGGLFFYADLVRAIEPSVELVTASAASYDPLSNGPARANAFQSTVEKGSFTGRRILLVDDICDSGNTLAKLQRSFIERGALEVRTAALIRRIVPDAPHVPHFVGFVYEGPEWFVGYGMDDKGAHRNLPAVYRMLPAS